jgi:hypothetical protein
MRNAHYIQGHRNAMNNSGFEYHTYVVLKPYFKSKDINCMFYIITLKCNKVITMKNIGKDISLYVKI